MSLRRAVVLMSVFAFVLVLVFCLVFALILVLDFFIECSSEAGPDGDRLVLVVMGETD